MRKREAAGQIDAATPPQNKHLQTGSGTLITFCHVHPVWNFKVVFFFLLRLQRLRICVCVSSDAVKGSQI